MKRWTCNAVLFLALGSALSCAVAWAIAWKWPEHRMSGEKFGRQVVLGHADVPRWRVLVERAPLGGVRVTRRAVGEGWKDLPVDRGGIPIWSDARGRPSPDHPRDLVVTETAYGWPFVALGYEYRWRRRHVGFSGLLRFFEDLRGGTALSDLAAGPNDWYLALHVVPYRPVWTGMLANACIYGCALWMPFWLFAFLRRRGRRRRGACVRCGYLLGGATTCSECGVAAG